MYYVILTLLAVGIPMFFLIRYFNKKYEREKYLYTEEEREWMERESRSVMTSPHYFFISGNLYNSEDDN